jgi:ATP-dependent Lon protease
VSGSDQHRLPGATQGLREEGGRVTGDVILLEEVAAAGDQVDLCLTGALDDALESRSQVAATALRANAVEALAREGPVQMQVGEM